MDVTTDYGEITKNIKVENFSTYSRVNDKIATVISVNLEEFRSTWNLTVFPMHPNKPQETSRIHCDITTELVCLSSSAPPSTVKNIEIKVALRGRENYSKLLQPSHYEVNPTWKAILVSHVTLNSLKLLQNDLFEFDVKFKIPKDTLYRSEDGEVAVVKDVQGILKDPQYFDTCLISSSGSRFYAHSSILHARSNILKRSKVLSLSHSHELHDEASEDIGEDFGLTQEEFIEEKHAPSERVSEPSSSVSYSSSSSSATDITHESPVKSQRPLFTFPGVAANKSATKVISESPLSSPSKNTRMLSPKVSSPRSSYNKRANSPSVSSPRKFSTTKRVISPSFTSPRKRDCGPCNSPFSPQKKIPNITASPGKNLTQTQLTNFFPRSSSLNVKSEPSDSISAPLSYLSPIKCHPHNSPSKFSCKINSPLTKTCSKENTTPKKETSIANILSRDSDIRSPCGTIPKQNFQNLKRKLFDIDIEDNRNVTILKINMSTSVLQELLCWIYTGQSSRLHDLARPLLVAGLRHKITDLSRAAQFYLASILSVKNTSELLHLSQKYEAAILKEECVQFCLHHASDVTATSAWAELALRYPEVMLSFTKRLAVFKG